MIAKNESGSSRLDSFKWLIVAALIAVAVVGNQYFSQESILFRVIGIVVALAVAFFVASKTAKGQSMLTLASEARGEIRKVVWPTRQEAVQTTLVVVAVVLVMGLLLWGLDSLLGWLVSVIVG